MWWNPHSKGHAPSRDWLSFTKVFARAARSPLHQRAEREEAKIWAAAAGKRRHFGRSLKKIPEADLLKQASDYGLSKLEDLYAAVGSGNIPRVKC